MSDVDGAASLEPLGWSECLELMALVKVGRLALIVHGRPEILPVNYVLDGDSVLFRTSESSVLNEASMAAVAFEVDHIDDSARSGWSVMIHGQAVDIGNAVDPTSERMRELSLISWAPGNRDRWFVVHPDNITGRRLRVLPTEL